MALSKITNSGIGAIDTLAVDTDTLVVDSTNNRVGIGTASPDSGVHVESSSGSNAQIKIQTGDTTSVSQLIFGDSADSNTGGIQYAHSDDSLQFHVGNIGEKMRIDSSGNLLVGQTATSGVNARGGLMVEPERDDGAARITFDRDTTSATSTAILFRDAGLSKGSIAYNNTSTTFSTSSDYRLKTAVTYDWDATTRLKQLRPARFEWIADGDDAVPVDGFLAHEVQSVVPEAITGTHNEVDDEGNPVYQGIDQSKLVPLLVKTIQELEARIAALENA
jgi:hypothetical protein